MSQSQLTWKLVCKDSDPCNPRSHQFECFPGGSLFGGPGDSSVSTQRRGSVDSTAKLVRLDHEVKEAAVEVPPQKTQIKVDPCSGVPPRMSQKEASG